MTLRRVKILVVDDEPVVLALFVRILMRAGHEVVACSNGREALAALESWSFDVIITDVSMPELSGVELVEAVRRRDLDVPILLVTGHPVVDRAVAATEHGVLECLEKPMEPSVLRDSVARAVAMHRRALGRL
jgi:DNA-binding NtrC family response regulator